MIRLFRWFRSYRMGTVKRFHWACQAPLVGLCSALGLYHWIREEEIKVHWKPSLDPDEGMFRAWQSTPLDWVMPLNPETYPYLDGPSDD